MKNKTQRKIINDSYPHIPEEAVGWIDFEYHANFVSCETIRICCTFCADDSSILRRLRTAAAPPILFTSHFVAAANIVDTISSGSQLEPRAAHIFTGFSLSLSLHFTVYTCRYLFCWFYLHYKLENLKFNK